MSDAATLPLRPAEAELGDDDRIGAAFGRYVVVRRLGSGGSADVFAAVDPMLERTVALKLLRASSEQQPHLLREGRLLARLSHPNVVGVYDVGVEDDRMFLAMELVAGDHLGAWLQRTPATSRGVLQMLLAVGEGIAAAHAAQIFHGDIKPANVLVGKDGVPKIGDFGIGRLAATPCRDEASKRPIGTPRYMAPEQREGTPPDAASDQYSFCLMVWEALTGEHPHARETTSVTEGLGTDGNTGESTATLDATRVAATQLSRRQLATLRRGLDPDPNARWPSMRALLAELRPPARGRWTAAAIVGGLLATASATALFAAEAPCAGAEEKAASLWNATTRAEVLASIEGTALPFASRTGQNAVAQLDDYATRWGTVHRDVCEATAVREEQSAELLDARMRCLHRAASGLSATVAVLHEADAAALEHADALLGGLPDVERCATVATGDPLIALPDRPGEAEAVARLLDRLAEVDARANAGQHADALAGLDAIEAEVRTLEFDPLRAEFEIHRADILRAMGRAEDAERAALDAMEPAARAGQWEHAAASAAILSYVTGVQLGRPAEGVAYAKTAVRLAAADGVGPTVRMVARHHLASALVIAGEMDAGLREYEAVAEAAREAGDVAARTIAQADAAAVLGDLGRRAAAVELLREVLREQVDAVGAEHPSVAVTRFNLASMLLQLDEADEAESHLEEALAVVRAAYGPDHPDAARIHQALGNMWSRRDRHEEALVEYTRAHELRIALLGDADPVLSESHLGLAFTLRQLGRTDEAFAHYEHAVRIANAGDTPQDGAVARNNYAGALREAGRVDEAERQLRLALAASDAVAPTHPLTTQIVLNLGALILDRGRIAEARDLLRRAWTQSRDSEDLQPTARGKAAFSFAQAVWSEEEPCEARSAADAARTIYAEHGPADRVHEVDAWLATHPGACSNPAP